MPSAAALPGLLLAGAVLVAACGPAGPPAPSQLPDAPAVTAPLLGFWERQGGAAVFGAPLEPARAEGGVQSQLFLNVELALGPDGVVRATPLGRRLGLAEPPVPPPAGPAARYFPATGHTLYTGFAAAYARLGGEAFAGAPIGEVRFGEGRIVQVFENLGLYREEAAAPSDVRLLALGVAASSPADVGAHVRRGAVLPPGLQARPFAPFLDRYGGEALFGRPLTEPYLTEEGDLEQVFERAVLYAPPEAPGQARLRPLGLLLGPAQPAVPPGPEPGDLYFTSTGHTVRWAFAAFYRLHDGERLLGLPLEEAEMLDGVLRQRFENAWLEFRFELPSPLAVQFAPLGLDYAPAGPVVPLPSPTPGARGGGTGEIVVRTWVEAPILPAGAAQRVTVEVLAPDGRPWPGLVPLVRVQTPRAAFFADVPPTGADGRTEFTLRIEDLRPGEIVNYEVAVSTDLGAAYALGQFVARLGDRTP